MNMDVHLVDAATNKEVREKELDSANNAWAAAWASGSTDRSLPSDMGKIIANYVLGIVPRK